MGILQAWMKSTRKVKNELLSAARKIGTERNLLRTLQKWCAGSSGKARKWRVSPLLVLASGESMLLELFQRSLSSLLQFGTLIIEVQAASLYLFTPGFHHHVTS